MVKTGLQDLLPKIGTRDSKVRLERIEVSDGTVGWDAIRISDGKRLGDIIRIERAGRGRQPRLSYYGRKEFLYYGREFPTKDQAIDYLATRRPRWIRNFSESTA